MGRQFKPGQLQTGSLYNISSSYAVTASYASNGGGSSTPPFPYTGLATITGSLTVTGSIIATTGFTGSLLGTASFAQTASYVLNAVSSSFATTASYIVIAQTASFVTGSDVVGTVTSASFAVSASYAPDTTFPYTGSALITGSLGVTGSFTVLTTPTSGSASVYAGFRMSDVPGAFFQLTNYSTSASAFVPTIRSFHPTTGTGIGLQLIAQIGQDGASNANPAMTFLVMSQSAAAGQIRNRTLFTWENNNTSSMALSTVGLVIGNNLLKASASLHINNTSSFNSFLVEDDTTPDSSPFVIDNIGQVGIGTTTPTRALDIVGQSGQQVVAQFKSPSPAGTLIDLDTAATSSYSGIRFYTSGSFGGAITYQSTGDYIQIGNNWVSGSEAASFDLTNKRVGIGKTTPTATLDITGSVLVTGSLIVTQGITGSLFGTSSWALNSTTASYVVTAQTASYILQAVSSSFATTASYAVNALSASYASSSLTASFAQTASYVLNSVSSSYAATASLAPLYLPLTGGTISGNVSVLGTASIAFLNVTYESASVIYSSGSNQFGDATNDTQTLIGRTIVSGSLEVTGSSNLPNITGSLFGTASFATTASYAVNALSASYAPSVSPFPFTGSARITGSLGVTGSVSILAFTSSAANIFTIRDSTNTQNLISLSGDGRIAIGLNAQILGTTDAYKNVVIGGGAKDISAAGVTENAVAFGYNAVSNNGGTAIGANTSITGVSGVALGANASAGISSVAVGAGAIADATSGYQSLAIGYGARASALLSGIIAVGQSSYTNALGQTLAFCVDPSGANSQTILLTNKANLVFRNSTQLTPGTHWDTTATNTLTIHSGSIPTTTVSGAFQMYAATGSLTDNTRPHFRTGKGTTIWLGDESRLFNVTASNVLIGATSSLALFTSVNTAVNVGTITIYAFPTASYDGAFIDYTARSGSNARAGQLMGIWSGSAVNYTETTTTDFGSTSAITFGMSISASSMIVSASATSTGWTVKTIIRSI